MGIDREHAARKRAPRRLRACLALLLALPLAAGSLPAVAEDGQNSFTFDLTASSAPADGASAFAPVTADIVSGAEDPDGAEEAGDSDGAAEAGEPVDADELADFGGAEETGDATNVEADDSAADDSAADTDDLADFGAAEGEAAGDEEVEGEEAVDADDGDENAVEGAADEDIADAEDDAGEETAPVEITITASGDTTLGGCPRNKSDKKFAKVAKSKGAGWFLSGVKKIFRKDDLTILNLEGPLTSAKQRRKGQWYYFKGDPRYVKILTRGSVEICNVANNHSLDYGAAGLKETAKVLKKAGIGVSGYDVSYTTTVKGVKVCSLGFTKWDHTAADIKKAVKAARKKCDLLIVSVHWGWEKKVKPDSEQRAMGRAAVDAGADLVIGTHSHVYGGIERYKGKYILYSLGNFCFGGNPNPTDKRCLIFQQTFSIDPETGVSDAGINIIPAKVSSAKKTNDYRPVLMGKGEGMKLLKAVAKVSRGFSPKNTLWTKSNYLVWAGIVSQKKLNAMNAKVKRSRARSASKAKQKAEAGYSAAALFADETNAALAARAGLDDVESDVVYEADAGDDAEAEAWDEYDEAAAPEPDEEGEDVQEEAGGDDGDDGLFSEEFDEISGDEDEVGSDEEDPGAGQEE